MAKLSSFTFANVGETLTVAPSDTVDFKNDSTNNPDGHDYFYPYTLTSGNITFIDNRGVQRVLTAVVANTTIPIPMRRVNATGTTATMLALIPKGY